MDRQKVTASINKLAMAAVIAVSAWPLFGHGSAVSDKFQRAYTAALLAEGRGDLADAIVNYRIAAERDPLYCVVFQNLGALLERQNRKAEALDAYQQALRCIRGKVVHAFMGYYPESIRRADIRVTSQRIEKLRGTVIEPR